MACLRQILQGWMGLGSGGLQIQAFLELMLCSSLKLARYPRTSAFPSPDFELVSKHQGNSSHSSAKLFWNCCTFLRNEWYTHQLFHILKNNSTKWFQNVLNTSCSLAHPPSFSWHCPSWWKRQQMVPHTQQAILHSRGLSAEEAARHRQGAAPGQGCPCKYILGQGYEKAGKKGLHFWREKPTDWWKNPL